MRQKIQEAAVDDGSGDRGCVGDLYWFKSGSRLGGRAAAGEEEQAEEWESEKVRKSAKVRK
jgi:hypothetical protein